MVQGMCAEVFCSRTSRTHWHDARSCYSDFYLCLFVCVFAFFLNSCQTNVGTVDAVLGTVLSYLCVIIIGRVVTYYVSSSTTIIKKMATDAYCHIQGLSGCSSTLSGRFSC